MRHTDQSHSVSSNTNTLIGTRLVSVEKVGDSSLFGGEYKGQNSLFLAFLWVVLWVAVELQKSITKIHFSEFFGQKG